MGLLRGGLQHQVHDQGAEGDGFALYPIAARPAGGHGLGRKGIGALDASLDVRSKFLVVHALKLHPASPRRNVVLVGQLRLYL